ncbi:16S rRNA (adenine(1518)-N(6)/adenine(1519)-N(6))-dimethyltransferase RsmA [Moheibacter lacus]|uniref:Ribosomal RNA small subunit methyltransferase A n=1 Tax=Moheibacter lacus TaxID=2745851 RepID=A0A838ZT58_9FLAO|nr:16S rRNA (adenine(1518)-N(6)/adenine(1519)-N(6))-dimethyltransferase RsmA [Moheibacter lacus]MBA5630175.1 16S rRNA (adenine(1518)-N(6)/adenine(1519)-N(6))-dimethyltransferase RsmA [Moheibacter lacus]
MSVKAKKHLGQHFLKDENIAKQIVDAMRWEGYEQALEIGPGMGVLTQFLIKEKKKISVVEIDSESVEYLNQHYPELPIYAEDFLRMNLAEKFKNEPIAVIGNFPYNISSQIVFKVIENRNQVPEMVGMFQKEVAERICAKEGSKIYGILSVLTQAYFKAEYLFTVDENVFNPPPKVKSGVIRLTRIREKLEVDEKLFFQVVKAAFNQRRKTLRNALKSLNLSQHEIEENFLNLRAEQLSVQQFVELTGKISG